VVGGSVEWSVSIMATGDRDMTREEIVELADAVAGHDGIAMGIGTATYGAMLIVEADDREAAIALGSRLMTEAVEVAGLPPWTFTNVGATSEVEAGEYVFDDE
jgi:hypothetical protein